MMKIRGRIRNEYKDIFDDEQENKRNQRTSAYRVETYFCHRKVEIEIFNNTEIDDEEVVIRRTKKWR